MKSVINLLALVVLVVSFTHAVFAQVGSQNGADRTATRTLPIGVFVGASHLKPDEGNYYNTFKTGYDGGLDATRSFGRTTISIEPTFGTSTGPGITLDYFLGNLLIGRAFGRGVRIHPFGMVGI